MGASLLALAKSIYYRGIMWWRVDVLVARWFGGEVTINRTTYSRIP